MVGVILAGAGVIWMKWVGGGLLLRRLCVEGRCISEVVLKRCIQKSKSFDGCRRSLVHILPTRPRRPRESDLRQIAWDGVWVYVCEPLAGCGEVFFGVLCWSAF